MAIYLNITTSGSTQQIKLGSKTLILGRSSSCDVRLTDPLISGKHLAVKLNTSGRALFKDLGTTNGTFINGKKIDEALVYLKDKITIGKIQISLDKEKMEDEEVVLHSPHRIKSCDEENDKKEMEYINLVEYTSNSDLFSGIDSGYSQDPEKPKRASLLERESGENDTRQIALKNQRKSKRKNDDLGILRNPKDKGKILKPKNIKKTSFIDKIKQKVKKLLKC